MPRSRIERLQERRTDPTVRGSDLNEVYKRIAENDAVRYALGAMQPIDNAYTRNTVAEGERVRNHLEVGLRANGIGAEFRYQGSVTSDTHIRAHSDIDLLSIHGSFFSLEPPQKPAVLYAGDPLADLLTMRSTAVRVLRGAMPSVGVDDSKSKAIALSGGSLRREVDVVIANWYDTVEYAATKTNYLRGVMILDSGKRERITNKPFLHNQRLDARDTQVRGMLRRTVRLLKSLKYDADEEPQISSYDIAAIAYNMPDGLLAVSADQELLLVSHAETYLRFLIENPVQRALLDVPNGMRKIFCAAGASEAGLRALHGEVVGLLRDITEGLARSFKKLEEARIRY